MPERETEAAVLIPIAEVSGRESILLTRRAEHLNSHSGEVAFPGGKRENADGSLLETALRESHEEMGILPADVSVEAELEPSYTRHGMRVTPFIGRISNTDSLRPDPSEIGAFFWFPLELLKTDPRVRTDIFTLEDREYWAPVYEYEGYTVWGFTARVLVEFLNTYCRIPVSRKHAFAQEVRYKKTN